MEGDPAPTGEEPPPWFQPFAQQIEQASQLAQAQDNRYWDQWAEGEENRARSEYEKIKGSPPTDAWVAQLHQARRASGATDLVLLTRGLLYEDIAQGRTASALEGADRANQQAQRGATEGGASSAQVPVDLKDLSDEDLYKRGKQALGLPTEDTRYILDQ